MGGVDLFGLDPESEQTIVLGGQVLLTGGASGVPDNGPGRTHGPEPLERRAGARPLSKLDRGSPRNGRVEPVGYPERHYRTNVRTCRVA